MVTFRDIKTLRTFASVNAPFDNHVNRDRHLNPRDIFRLNRFAARAGRRQLAPSTRQIPIPR